MRVDEPGRDQPRPVVMHPGLWMAGAKIGRFAHVGNAARVNEDRAMGDRARGIRGCERVALIAQHLSQNKIGHCIAPVLVAPA